MEMELRGGQRGGKTAAQELDADAASAALATAFERISRQRTRVDRIILRVCELPERSGPDVMMVTPEELRRILVEELG